MTVDDLVPPLAAILQDELAAGNEIAEVGEWGPKCELLVILRRPFARRYAVPEAVEFEAINDPHYWMEEYRYRGGRQTLACGFGLREPPLTGAQEQQQGAT